MHALSVLTLATLAAAAPSVSRRAEPAALVKPKGANAKLLPNKYIVKMKNDAEVSVAATKYKAERTYSHSINGFAATLTDKQLEAVRDDPNVDYVEHDQEFNLFDFVSQDDAPWHLSRVSHTENGATKYVYDESAGEGTCTYIIDTGIKVDHEEFEGRAEFLHNFTDDGTDDDGAGHGTFVAGIVASRTYGVAKKGKVLALKVFNNDGQTGGSWIIDAMDYVVQDAGSRDDCPNGYIANMSLGGGFSQASNDATDAMVNAGVFVAVAAGNSDTDAAETSPASAALACTVGASDNGDSKADFSSWGEVLDVWAPGVDIESTSYEGGSTSASGTSAASPVVAGVGAYLMALEDIAGGYDVCDRIKELGVEGILQGIPEGTVNLLNYNGAPAE